MPDGVSGLQFTITNVLQFASFISPFILGFFLVMSSIFNQDIKGFIYLGGVLISTIINIFLLNIIRHESSPNRAPICDVIDFNIFSMGGSFDNPNFNFLQFRANLVLRWEYTAGSTLYLVWSQGRTDYFTDGGFHFRNNVRDLFNVIPHNVFLVKISYSFNN